MSRTSMSLTRRSLSVQLPSPARAGYGICVLGAGADDDLVVAPVYLFRAGRRSVWAMEMARAPRRPNRAKGEAIGGGPLRSGRLWL